jgi:hypothetical protein
MNFIKNPHKGLYITISKIIEPYSPRLSSFAVSLLGKISKSICEPSRGGMGRRLNANKNILKKTPYQKRFTITESRLPVMLCEITKPIKNIIASIKLDIGPAAETIASSLNAFLKLFGLTGTGFAQPISAKPEANDASGIISVPTRSACLNGLSVSLPRLFAVLSPSLLAEKACANSWMVIEIINIGKKVKNEISFSLIWISPI